MVTGIVRSVSDLYGKELIAYGTGYIGKGVIPYLAQLPDVKLLGVTNSRVTEEYAGTFQTTNLPIRSPKTWIEQFPNATVLVTADITNTADEIFAKCKEIGFQEVLFLSWETRDSFNIVQREAMETLQLMCGANEIHEMHKAAFSEFRSCHRGQTVAVVGAGPTLNYYSQLPGVPHIGVNSTFLRNDLKLDYYFLYHYKPEWFEELKKREFIKFYAKTSLFGAEAEIPEYFVEETGGRPFVNGKPELGVHVNIEYYPLASFNSIIFSAFHFALYTRPKRILLVGCDCTDAIHYDGSAMNVRSFEVASPGATWKEGHKRMKKFAERYYPDVEIVSVNPVGLKGIFRDVYTDCYLDARPEFDRTQCEILK